MGENTHRRLRIAAKFFAFMALLTLFVLAAIRLRNQSAWNHELASQREAGLPASIAELNALYPPVPEEENAALKFLEAIDTLPDIAPELRDALPIAGEGISFGGEAHSDEGIYAMRAYLAQCGEALAFVHEGASKPRARYPVDFDAALWEFGIPTDHLAGMHALGNLSATALALAVHARDAERALVEATAGMALARSLEAMPLRIAVDLRHSVEATIALEVDRGVSLHTFDDSALQSLDSLFARIPDYRAFRHVAVAEQTLELLRGAAPIAPLQYGMMASLRLLTTVRPNAPLPSVSGRSVIPVAIGAFFGIADVPKGISAYKARRYRYTLEAFSLPRRETTSVYEKMPRGAVWLEHVETAITGDEYRFYPEAFDNGFHPIEVLRGRIHIERYRLRYGRLPNTLEDLVPEFVEKIPVDPYDGAPLAYEVEGQSYSLAPASGYYTSFFVYTGDDGEELVIQ